MDELDVLLIMPHAINITELGGVARAFAVVAKARWPEFLEHATVENGSLRLDVLSPSRATYLRINPSIDYDEIIIGIGGGHSHGGPWEEPGDPDYQLEASIRFKQEGETQAKIALAAVDSQR